MIVGIKMGRMPKYCSECPFLMLVKGVCAYCMGTRHQIKMSELDLIDSMCPLTEIPRCKNCTHWNERYGCEVWVHDTEADDYCSRGERK